MDVFLKTSMPRTESIMDRFLKTSMLRTKSMDDLFFKTSMLRTELTMDRFFQDVHAADGVNGWLSFVHSLKSFNRKVSFNGSMHQIWKKLKFSRKKFKLYVSSKRNCFHSRYVVVLKLLIYTKNIILFFFRLFSSNNHNINAFLVSIIHCNNMCISIYIALLLFGWRGSN
jgi:hypothetical protein